MNLRNWEVIIQKVLEEFNRQPKEPGQYRVLVEWRAKLAREPHLLEPHQIDAIVREVRKRSTSVVQRPSDSSVGRLAMVASTGLL